MTSTKDSRVVIIFKDKGNTVRKSHICKKLPANLNEIEKLFQNSHFDNTESLIADFDQNNVEVVIKFDNREKVRKEYKLEDINVARLWQENGHPDIIWIYIKSNNKVDRSEMNSLAQSRTFRDNSIRTSESTKQSMQSTKQSMQSTKQSMQSTKQSIPESQFSGKTKPKKVEEYYQGFDNQMAPSPFYSKTSPTRIVEESKSPQLELKNSFLNLNNEFQNPEENKTRWNQFLHNIQTKETNLQKEIQDYEKEIQTIENEEQNIELLKVKCSVLMENFDHRQSNNQLRKSNLETSLNFFDNVQAENTKNLKRFQETGVLKFANNFMAEEKGEESNVKEQKMSQLIKSIEDSEKEEVDVNSIKNQITKFLGELNIESYNVKDYKKNLRNSIVLLKEQDKDVQNLSVSLRNSMTIFNVRKSQMNSSLLKNDFEKKLVKDTMEKIDEKNDDFPTNTKDNDKEPSPKKSLKFDAMLNTRNFEKRFEAVRNSNELLNFDFKNNLLDDHELSAYQFVNLGGSETPLPESKSSPFKSKEITFDFTKDFESDIHVSDLKNQIANFLEKIEGTEEKITNNRKTLQKTVSIIFEDSKNKDFRKSITQIFEDQQNKSFRKSITQFLEMEKKDDNPNFKSKISDAPQKTLAESILFKNKDRQLDTIDEDDVQVNQYSRGNTVDSNFEKFRDSFQISDQKATPKNDAWSSLSKNNQQKNDQNHSGKLSSDKMSITKFEFEGVTPTLFDLTLKKSQSISKQAPKDEDFENLIQENVHLKQKLDSANYKLENMENTYNKIIEDLKRELNSAIGDKNNYQKELLDLKIAQKLASSKNSNFSN